MLGTTAARVREVANYILKLDMCTSISHTPLSGSKCILYNAHPHRTTRIPTSQVRAGLSYQLPPRKLWAWWCGGLSVKEVLWVAFWLGLMVCWLYNDNMARWEKAEGGRWAGWFCIPRNGRP